MKEKVIFFDLDDTLVVEIASAEESFIEAGKYAEKLYGLNPNRLHESVRKQARRIWYDMPTYHYCKKIGISSWEGLWARFNGDNLNVKELHKRKESYQINSWYNALLDFKIQDIELAKELAKRFNDERRKRHILFPDVKDVLETVTDDYRLGIITNGIPDLQWEKIHGAGIEDFFENIIISGDFDVCKPDKEIFSIALKKFQALKKNCIMVGDSIKTDIIGANNNGINSVWVNRNNKENKYPIKPDFIISNLIEIINILNFDFINFKKKTS